jgi:hypothetical protein
MSGKEILTGRWATATRSLAPKPKPPRFCTRRRLASCCDEALRITYTINSILMRQSLAWSSPHQPVAGLTDLRARLGTPFPAGMPEPGGLRPSGTKPRASCVGQTRGEAMPRFRPESTRRQSSPPEAGQKSRGHRGRRRLLHFVVALVKASAASSAHLVHPPSRERCNLRRAVGTPSSSRAPPPPLHLDSSSSSRPHPPHSPMTEAATSLWPPA